MDSSYEYKTALVKQLHETVKLCQKTYVNKTEVVSESDEIVSELIRSWENIFYYGLKKKTQNVPRNSITDVPAQIIRQIKPFNSNSNKSLKSSNNVDCNNESFWNVLSEFLASEEISRFSLLVNNSYSKYQNDSVRARAWIKAALNEHTLELMLNKMLSNSSQTILVKYYDSFSILLDSEENTMLPNLAAGLSSIVFSLDLSQDFLNNKRYQHLSSSSSSSITNGTSRSILFSSASTGECFNSFDEIEIDSTASPARQPVSINHHNASSKGSTNDNNVSIMYSNNSKTRIINILPIDDDEDSNTNNSSDTNSSDLYSPFALIKSGLNFVSKFQFGNDNDRLSDIKEHSHIIDEDDYHKLCLLNNPHHPQSEDTDSASLRDSPPAQHNFTRSQSSQSQQHHHHDNNINSNSPFKHCSLSLKPEFYGQNTNGLTNNNRIDENESHMVNTTDTNNNQEGSFYHTNVQLLVESTDSQQQSEISSNTDNSLHIRQLEEIIDQVKKENTLMKQEIKSLNGEFKNKHNQLECEVKKLNRENELLRKRLKNMLLQSNQSIAREIANSETGELEQSSGQIHETITSSGEVVIDTLDQIHSADKMSQLTQMHADLMELNYQLQRSLVDKDLKISTLQSKLSSLMYNEQTSGTHIDGLGTIHVEIIDYKMCGKSTRQYLCYCIRVICTPLTINNTNQYDSTCGSTTNHNQSTNAAAYSLNYEWKTYRRYKEFHKFYQDLTSRFPIESRQWSLQYVFPTRWLFYRPTEEQIQQRKSGLEQFLLQAITMLLMIFMKQRANSNHKSSRSNSQSSDCGSLKNGNINDSTSLGNGSQHHHYQSLASTSVHNIVGDCHDLFEANEPVYLSKELILKIVPFLAESPLSAKDSE